MITHKGHTGGKVRCTSNTKHSPNWWWYSVNVWKQTTSWQFYRFILYPSFKLHIISPTEMIMKLWYMRTEGHMTSHDCHMTSSQWTIYTYMKTRINLTPSLTRMVSDTKQNNSNHKYCFGEILSKQKYSIKK